MKILFLTSSIEDYLGDSVLPGLRELYGSDCVDYPKCEILYKNCPPYILNQVRGKGFTLYTGLLDDIEVDRFNIELKVQAGFFDLIIFGDIQRQYGLFVHFRPWLKRSNTIVMDGVDTVFPYPARGFWWRRPYYWFLPTAHQNYLYFKREWTPDTYFSLGKQFLYRWFKLSLPQSPNLRRVSFSIPEEKIVSYLPAKTKDFPKHIVDEEIVEKIEGTYSAYAFDSEKDYYDDLRASRFGITTKRGGWDCLRHYEIAANGAVICFRDLDQKPETCAPHGLIDGINCLSYKNYDDLISRINSLSEDRYKQLQVKSLEWAHENNNVNSAKRILKVFRNSMNKSLEKGTDQTEQEYKISTSI